MPRSATSFAAAAAAACIPHTRYLVPRCAQHTFQYVPHDGKTRSSYNLPYVTIRVMYNCINHWPRPPVFTGTIVTVHRLCTPPSHSPHVHRSITSRSVQFCPHCSGHRALKRHNNVVTASNMTGNFFNVSLELDPTARHFRLNTIFCVYKSPSDSLVSCVIKTYI